jgi:hypothetical protein
MTTSSLRSVRRAPVSRVQREAEQRAVRDQVQRLRKGGGTYRSIAAAADLSPTTIHGLAHGHHRAQAATAAALLAVASAPPVRVRVDAGGARLRLRALHVMGHGSVRIARATGANAKTIRKLLRGDVTTISPQLNDAIRTVYDAWWDKRAPTRNRKERAAAAGARRRAVAGNWCPGAALDDELLDVPGYRPEHGWKPAIGTGIAGDVTAPAVNRRAKASA